VTVDDVVLLVVLAGTGALAIWWIVKNRGISGAILGGKVLETVGEIPGVDGPLVSSSLRVRTVQTGGDPDIALEFAMRTLARWHITPIRLTRAQARDLIRLLERATGA
jgi:hypothetical protein